MDDELTPTARTILGFLSLHPRSGYEIREAAKRAVSFFWGVSDGQLYPQLKVLAAKGLIEPRDPAGDGGPRARQVWKLTAAGRAELRAWLHAPSEPLNIRDENLVKILFAAQLDRDEAVRLIEERRAAMIRFRDHLGSVVPASTWSDAERAAANPTPALVRDYGFGFAQTIIDWCDQAASTLGKDPS